MPSVTPLPIPEPTKPLDEKSAVVELSPEPIAPILQEISTATGPVVLTNLVELSVIRAEDALGENAAVVSSEPEVVSSKRERRRERREEERERRKTEQKLPKKKWVEIVSKPTGREESGLGTDPSEPIPEVTTVSGPVEEKGYPKEPVTTDTDGQALLERRVLEKLHQGSPRGGRELIAYQMVALLNAAVIARHFEELIDLEITVTAQLTDIEDQINKQDPKETKELTLYFLYPQNWETGFRLKLQEGLSLVMKEGLVRSTGMRLALFLDQAANLTKLTIGPIEMMKQEVLDNFAGKTSLQGTEYFNSLKFLLLQVKTRQELNLVLEGGDKSELEKYRRESVTLTESQL